MGSGVDLAVTAEQALDVVRAVARMDAGVVYRLDGARARLELVASRGLGPDEIARVRVRPLAEGPAGEAARTGRAVIAAGGAELALPISVRGEAWGVMALVSAARRVYDGDELTLLEAVAHQVGLAVHRATLFAETQAESSSLPSG